MRQFDFYEFVSYVVPGCMMLIGLTAAWTNDWSKLSALDVSVGGFGLAIVIAYAIGQLIQDLGHLLVRVFWKACGGMPTDWVRSGIRQLLADVQQCQIEPAIASRLNIAGFQLSPGVSAKDWHSITRQVYARLNSAGRSARIDMFNGIYGLSRGMATALLLLLVLVPILNWPGWWIEILLVLGVTMSTHRMYRFGVHYGRELFVQFLTLP